MKKVLLSLLAISLITTWLFTFAQESDWIKHDADAWTVTIYSADGSYWIVIMDKNLWATEVWGWTGLDVSTYWNYYQWWNNYGFPSDSNATVTVSSTKVDASWYWPGNPYSSGTFIKACYSYNNWCSDWSSVRNDNLRWWEWDDDTNWWGLTSNNPITGRQGPCPDWWHVPSVWEIDEFIVMWYNHKYNADLPAWSLIYSDTLQEEGINVAADFSKDIFMPFASLYWWGEIEPYYYNIAGQFWSSSAYSNMWFTLSLTLRNGKSGIIKNAAYLADDNYRSTAMSVRCFKNEKIVNDPNAIVVTFDANWWDSITTWSATVALWNTLDISNYSWAKDGWNFVWWNTNPWDEVAMSNPVIRWPMTLYAIYEKEVTVSYALWDWVASIWKESDSCLMNKVEIWCTVVAPSITPSKEGYSGRWSNWNTVVNPSKRITLTGDTTYTAGIIPNTYTVHYYSPDWYWNMSDQSFTYDVPQKLRKNTFTWSWYVFSGWRYNGVSYKDKQEVLNLTSANNKTLTFTAQRKVDPGYIVHWPFYTSDGKEFMIAVSTSDWTINTWVTLAENSWYTESELLGILWNDLENTNAEIVDVEDLGGDVLFLKSPDWTEFTTKWFCSIEWWCSYFETNESKDVTDDFKNQAMDTENVQWPTRVVSSSDYLKYNEIWSSGYVVLVKNGDINGYVYVPIKKYTVIWENPDWSNLRTDVNVKYWTIPSYGGIPEKPSDGAYTYEFTGWNPEVSAVTWNITYTAVYTQTPISIEYTITFVLWNGEPDILITWAYGAEIKVPANPTREWYTFDGRSEDVPETMPAENKTIYAKWIEKGESKSSWWSSWWGGGWHSDSTDSQTNTHWSADNSEDSDLDGLEIVNYNPDLPAEQQTLSDGLTPEMHRAYKFAYKHWITTMPTILEADMFGPLDRISMAKMLSQYAINVLWKTPDTSIEVPAFPDITPELNEQFWNAVTLAYQLWIMWINIDEFRPFDLVPRSEFGTALSRMLYQTSDWIYEKTDEYYTPHFEKLKIEWIMSVFDPYMKELRWYVMIMLMRSAEKNN